MSLPFISKKPLVSSARGTHRGGDFDPFGNRTRRTAPLAWILLSLAFVLPNFSSSVPAAEKPKSIPFEETGPFLHVDGSGLHRDSHNLLVHHRNTARLAAAPLADSRDEGDVAVIVDNGALILEPRSANLFDLLSVGSGSLTFTPSGAGDDYTLTVGALALDLGFGSALTLTDDDSAAVPLPGGFPFLGAVHSQVFVNTDGNLTFGEADVGDDPRDAARLLAGPPRIAPLLADLNPEQEGSIHADPRADRLVVTWDGVARLGEFAENRFQAVLHADGRIDFVYDLVNADFAVVGLSGGEDALPIQELDLSEAAPATVTLGTVFEEFHREVSRRDVDHLAVAKVFYRTHEDRYDFLVIFTDFPVDLFGAFAFAQVLSNQTAGIGFSVGSDASALAGSDGELETLLAMNNIHLYWPDAEKLVNPPIKKFRFGCDGFTASFGFCQGRHFPPGDIQLSNRARWMGTLNGDLGGQGSYTLGLNSAMSVMAQEAGHRWGAFLLFRHPSKGFAEAFDLLGRSFSHWSFFTDTEVPPEQFGGDPRASGLEGNVLRDLGPFPGLGAFPCVGPGESLMFTDRNQLIDGYSELDQYLMGLRTADEVSSFWYADEPRSPFTGASLEGLRFFDAVDDFFFCGKRVDLTVADLTVVGETFGLPQFGPRIPALGDEVDAVIDGEPVDVKTMAFILVTTEIPAANADAVRRVDIFRSTWEEYANGPATGGRGRFDTRLDPPIH